MTKKAYKKFKITRRVALLLAAAPLFQLSQCNTFGNRVGANFTNALPSAVFQVLFSFALLPLQLIIGGGQVQGAGSGTGGGGI
ncbi:MAG TPA: hypothetical protein VNT79_03705 [Phycisphaerae bacterium]|nr:hypothetical protein [Phycisphaerae bacterium]